MMTFDNIIENVADQERGRECELIDPVTGEPTGIKLWIVGPDSKTAHDARIALTDELMDRTRSDGTVSGADRERARLNSLARLITKWEIVEDGKALAFNQKNILRLLSVSWVEAQVDAYASDRSAFREVV